jgi:hypothetical protein
MMEATIRKELIETLEGKGSHIPFSKAIHKFPFDLAGKKVRLLEHTAWSLVFHMGIAQRDILEFSRDPDYESPPYPKGYWPETLKPASPQEWKKTIQGIAKDLGEMIALIKDPRNDLFAPFPWGDGQTLFREAMVLAGHNSYHIGQLIAIRQLLGAPVRDW